MTRTRDRIKRAYIIHTTLTYSQHVLLMKSKALSSFFDFKAEIAKQEEEFNKNKAGGKSNVVVGDVKRTYKGSKKNRDIDSGVKAIVDADSSLPALEPFDAARAALEHKARIYDQLKSGMTGGLSEQQYDALLVDVSGVAPFLTFSN
jgi:hypothetical protein